MRQLLSLLPQGDLTWFCNEEQLCDRIWALQYRDAQLTLTLIQNVLAADKQYWDATDLNDFVLAIWS